MIPIMTPQDYKEAARREHFKRVEEERRGRFYNSKQRTIGIDYEALDRQIREKKDRELQERLEEEMWNRKQIDDMRLVNARARQMEDDKKNAHRELNEYRCQFQKWRDRREFDLNDPTTYFTPLVVDPNDGRFGVSSMTRFEGQEDVPGLRQRIQLQQQHAWLQQQMLEQHQQRCAQKTAAKALEQAGFAEIARYRALKDLEEECRREQERKTADFNKALAVQKMTQKLESMKREIEEVNTHNMNVLNSNLMIESRESAESGLGPGRVTASNFKGLSEAEKREIKRIQLEQIAEKADRKRKEEIEEKAWIDYQINVNNNVNTIDSRLANEAKRRDEEMRKENKILMEAHKARTAYLDKHVYTNKCSDEYFKQFNKSTR